MYDNFSNLSSDSYYLDGDPRTAGPQPPFNSEPQDSPGLESEMNPKPDYGYTSYHGSGGDSGIGRAVALAFAREGASIAIAYLNETEDAKEIQEVIQNEGHDCILIPGDVTEEAQCKKIIDETVAQFKRIDILVNNAAYAGGKVVSLFKSKITTNV
ncbi:unnamed protein product [Rotaria sp. Silwood2]|nr:unnamed protein product [Rotaria sp. Silwood2]CAF2815946.1 unnamed protein product [Rotaria sp. Silwood2]CAF4008548.1 unnamed protein product [Rotaria sp. Silwood2]